MRYSCRSVITVDSLPCSDGGKSPFFTVLEGLSVAGPGMEVRASYWFSWSVHITIRKNMSNSQRQNIHRTFLILLCDKTPSERECSCGFA